MFLRGLKTNSFTCNSSYIEVHGFGVALGNDSKFYKRWQFGIRLFYISRNSILYSDLFSLWLVAKTSQWFFLWNSFSICFPSVTTLHFFLIMIYLFYEILSVIALAKAIYISELIYMLA